MKMATKIVRTLVACPLFFTAYGTNAQNAATPYNHPSGSSAPAPTRCISKGESK